MKKITEKRQSWSQKHWHIFLAHGVGVHGLMQAKTRQQEQIILLNRTVTDATSQTNKRPSNKDSEQNGDRFCTAKLDQLACNQHRHQCVSAQPLSERDKVT